MPHFVNSNCSYTLNCWLYLIIFQTNKDQIINRKQFYNPDFRRDGWRTHDVCSLDYEFCSLTDVIIWIPINKKIYWFAVERQKLVRDATKTTIMDRESAKRIRNSQIKTRGGTKLTAEIALLLLSPLYYRLGVLSKDLTVYYMFLVRK